MLFKIFSRSSFRKSLCLSFITMSVLMIIRSFVFSLKEHNSPLLPSGQLELFCVMLLRYLVMLYFAYTLLDAVKELVLLFGEVKNM